MSERTTAKASSTEATPIAGRISVTCALPNGGRVTGSAPSSPPFARYSVTVTEVGAALTLAKPTLVR